MRFSARWKFFLGFQECSLVAPLKALSICSILVSIKLYFNIKLNGFNFQYMFVSFIQLPYDNPSLITWAHKYISIFLSFSHEATSWPSCLYSQALLSPLLNNKSRLFKVLDVSKELPQRTQLLGIRRANFSPTLAIDPKACERYTPEDWAPGKVWATQHPKWHHPFQSASMNIHNLCFHWSIFQVFLLLDLLLCLFFL